MAQAARSRLGVAAGYPKAKATVSHRGWRECSLMAIAVNVVTLHSTQAIHDSADVYFAPIAQKLDSVLRDCPAEDLATVTAIVTRLRTALDEAMASTGHP
jgi:hypothetical protein